MPTQKNFFKLLFIILIPNLLTACGPIYSTSYSYLPPRSSQGMMCISNCTSAQGNCEQLEELKDQNCRQQAEFAYQLCKNRGEKDCYHSSCYSSRSDHCTYRFNECYQSCGGTVTPQRVCTAFCN